MPVAQLRLPHQLQHVVCFLNFLHCHEESLRRIAASCAKSCALDPLLSSILTFCLDELLPVIRKIVNLSLNLSLASLRRTGRML